MILKLAKKRKTVRKFKQENVPVEKLLKCIEIAKEAPSGMNAQPWHFLIVSDPIVKANIRRMCEDGEKTFYERVKGELGEWLKDKGFTWKKPFLEEAQLLLLVFSYTKAPYSKESTWLAIGYLLLALEEEGLGTVTYTPSNPGEIAKLVGAPKEYRLETILPIGYPNDKKPKEPRKNLEEIVSMNKFENNIQPLFH